MDLLTEKEEERLQWRGDEALGSGVSTMAGFLVEATCLVPWKISEKSLG